MLGANQRILNMYCAQFVWIGKFLDELVMNGAATLGYQKANTARSSGILAVSQASQSDLVVLPS